MEDVMEAVFAGLINPGELSISRVIEPAVGAIADTDIAQYSGNRLSYTISGIDGIPARTDGFVEVNKSDYLTRYKALDNVGMNVRNFDNHEGGTMTYWSGDLLKKLADREYVHVQSADVATGNGVKGQRHDFDYTPRGEGPHIKPKFYTALLFVTKKNIVVVELAGDAELADEYRKRIPEITAAIKVR